MEEKIIPEAEEVVAAENIVEIPAAGAENAPEAAAVPMAWHKFQKNFLLWAVMLFYLARAFLIFSGRIYSAASVKDFIYGGMPLLRVLDYAFALHCAACGALLAVSAVRLNGKSADMLTKTNIIMAAGEIAYVLIRWAVTELPPLNLQCAALMIAHVLLWRVNRVYYGKRNYLLRKAEK